MITANMIDGLMTHVFEDSGEERWIEARPRLAAILREEFASRSRGGSRDSTNRRSHEATHFPQRDAMDQHALGNRWPRPNLLRLAALERPRRPARNGAGSTSRSRASAVHDGRRQSLIASISCLAPTSEPASARAGDRAEFEAVLGTRFLRRAFYYSKGRGRGHRSPFREPLRTRPLLTDRPARGGKRPTTYICDGLHARSRLRYRGSGGRPSRAARDPVGRPPIGGLTSVPVPRTNAENVSMRRGEVGAADALEELAPKDANRPSPCRGGGGRDRGQLAEEAMPPGPRSD